MSDLYLITQMEPNAPEQQRKPALLKSIQLRREEKKKKSCKDSGFAAMS